MTLFERILTARGVTSDNRAYFLSPNYDNTHDPFLLPDMDKAIGRLLKARAEQEMVVVYGDYDIDGLTATAVLLDAFEQFGFSNISAFIPNRFVEGYGLTTEAIETIAGQGATLIITVDCGSLSHEPIQRAKDLGVEVIVTDHHNVAIDQPPAVAVINPKRLLQDYPSEYDGFLLKPESNKPLYPFVDLAGVGVAFKLVQALQTQLEGLPKGQEKWLLDLVALGTVCDIVTLQDENRTFVFWGLKVLQKTRRVGLRALLRAADVAPYAVSARSLGFGLGPRMNAAGRLETAQYSLDLLRTTNLEQATELAKTLDIMNRQRRQEQDRIYEEAVKQAAQYETDSVLVVSSENWSHGIIGIVAAKLLEKFKKPTYVLEEMGDESKGSARSFGDFSAADAIRAADDIITKGGGHKFAAGVTLPTKNIADFRRRVNEYYQSQNLTGQQELLLPRADTEAEFSELTIETVQLISQLEPFGNGNPEPVLLSKNTMVVNKRVMGDSGQHVKLTLKNNQGNTLDVIAFSAPEHFFAEPGESINVWYSPMINSWNGSESVEGRLLHIEIA